MSKTKKTLIISAVLIIVGIIGAIPSGFIGIPKLLKQVEYNIDNISTKEKDIASFSEDIEELKLDFNSNNFSVELRESKDKLLHLKAYEGFEKSIKLDKSYDKNSKTLSLKPKLRSGFRNNIINRFNIKQGIASIITNEYVLDKGIGSKLIIEVPKGVNLDVYNLGDSLNSEFIVQDNKVLKEYLNINASCAKIKLPHFNTLKKVYINNMEVDLDLREFVNASDVNIKGSNVRIYSGGETSNYNIKNLPEKVIIAGSSIDINSFIPLGKNVNISSEDFANIQIPFDKYNLSGKITNPYMNEISEDWKIEEYFNFNNMKLSLKEVKMGNLQQGNIFDGKYSSATGDEFKMNVTTRGGEFRNSTVEELENLIRISQ